MQENTFHLGWNFDMAHRVYDIGRHISATNLHRNLAPVNLRIALAGNNPDNKIWNSAYNKEYDGLRGLKVFTKITTANCNFLVVVQSRFFRQLNKCSTWVPKDSPVSPFI